MPINFYYLIIRLGIIEQIFSFVPIAMVNFTFLKVSDTKIPDSKTSNMLFPYTEIVIELLHAKVKRYNRKQS